MWNSSAAPHSFRHCAVCVHVCVCQEGRRHDVERELEREREREMLAEEEVKQREVQKNFGSPHANSGLHHFFILSQI